MLDHNSRTIGDYRFELRSKERIDDTFEYKKGVYIKTIYQSECDSIKNIYVYGVYNDEVIEIYRINSNTNQFLVFSGSTFHYSEMFISEVLNGSEGKDIFAWCDTNVFKEFYIMIEEYPTHNNKQKIFISLEQAKEYVSLLRLEG